MIDDRLYLTHILIQNDMPALKTAVTELLDA